MIDETEYNHLKKVIEKLERERDEARGAKKQLMSELKSEYNCSTIAEAKKLMKKLKAEEQHLEKEFNLAFKKFQREYKDVIGAIKEGRIPTHRGKKTLSKAAKARKSSD